MSLNAITVDIVRDIVTDDDSGGESVVPSVVYAGLSVTASYKDLSSVYRHETTGGPTMGPGVQTESRRVVFLEPWDGSVLVEVNDRVVPNPAVSDLPAAMTVVGVRPYADGAAGELQLDVEDV